MSKSITILSPHMLKELRSDHAGETGAVNIYRGIIAIAGLKGQSQLIDFARQHCETESEHLRLIEAVLPKSEWSSLLIPWRIAGWLTGAIPTLVNSHCVYATIEAVETFVDFHYQQQIDYLEGKNISGTLPDLLKRCQQDECHHRDQAAQLAGGDRGFLLRSWCSLIGAGSAIAVSMARRL
jgi:ubiquinone biosynthesis monooxygenase Coq7